MACKNFIAHRCAVSLLLGTRGREGKVYQQKLSGIKGAMSPKAGNLSIV